MTRAMIKQYTAMVEFLSKALGPDYEIALHDLNDKNNSIVAIANGHISGRTIGAPLSNVALRFIASREYEKTDYKVNYSGISVGNKLLRSSTMFIKDESGKLVGLLCINFDDSRFKELSTRLFQMCHPDDYVEQRIYYNEKIAEMDQRPGDEPENFHNSISAVMEDVIQQVTQGSQVPVDRLTHEEKMHIVEMLEEKGIFLLKGAVHHVAQSPCCSQASIYRYLSKLNREKKEG